jgi:hypothetical protein
VELFLDHGAVMFKVTDPENQETAAFRYVGSHL